MHIEFTDEQQMLQDSAEKYFRDTYDFNRRQEIVHSGKSFDPDHWNSFAELGWLALPISEDHGGLGGGALDVMLLAESLGRHLVIEPYLETVILAGGLLDAAGPNAKAAEYLEGIVEGRTQGAFAATEPGTQSALWRVATTAEKIDRGYRLSGSKCVVYNGSAADFFIVSARTSGSEFDRDGISLFMVDAKAAGLTRRCYPTYDGRNAADLVMDNVELDDDALVGPYGKAWPIIQQVVNRALLAVSAEAVGAMDALVHATVDYTKQRKQFGQPIAKFQVLRHRMADMYMQCELTRSLLLAATWKFDNKSPDSEKYIAALKAKVGKAAKYISQNAIQLHGGIATTDELNIGHYFKRLSIIDNFLGARDFHLERFYQLR